MNSENPAHPENKSSRGWLFLAEESQDCCDPFGHNSHHALFLFSCHYKLLLSFEVSAIMEEKGAAGKWAVVLLPPMKAKVIL